MTTKAELEAALAKVREARAGLPQLTAAELVCQERLELTPEWADAKAWRQKKLDALQAISAAEDEARWLALAAYAETADKHPTAGVTVKLFTKLDYALDTATAWARTAMPALMKLDVKAFEKIAKNGLPGVEDMPVTITQEPRAEIASVL